MVVAQENTTIGIAKIVPAANIIMKTMERIQEVRMRARSVLLDIINHMQVHRRVMPLDQEHTKVPAAVFRRDRHVALENIKINRARVLVNTVA